MTKRKDDQDSQTPRQREKTGETPRPEVRRQSYPRVGLRVPNLIAEYQEGDVVFPPAREIGSSGDLLSGSILAIEHRIEAVENSLGELSASVTRTASGREQVEQTFEPIRLELTGMKQEVSQLQEVKSSLLKVGGFLRENASFLADAVSAKGQIQGIQSRIDSHEQRLTHLEGRSDVRWSRGIAIASVLVAVVAASILCYTTFLR